MANSRVRTILLDGPRNAVVNLTGTLDSGNENWTPAFSLSDFVNNDTGMMGTLWGFRINKLRFSVTNQLTGQLYWQANTPILIAALSDGDDLSYRHAGGLIPNRLASGFNGAINFVTNGFIPGTPCGYTVHLEMVKLYARP